MPLPLSSMNNQQFAKTGSENSDEYSGKLSDLQASFELIEPLQAIINENPRFANPPKYKNYTDLLLDAPEIMNPYFTPPPVNPYATGYYTSNSILDVYPHYPQPMAPPGCKNIYNQPYHLPVQTLANQYYQQHPQISKMNMYPPYAGSIPQLRDARLNDYAIALREGTGNSRVMRAPGLEQLERGGIEGYEGPLKKEDVVVAPCSFMIYHIMYLLVILILIALVVYFCIKSSSGQKIKNLY